MANGYYTPLNDSGMELENFIDVIETDNESIQNDLADTSLSLSYCEGMQW